jgi:hypothetical protein
MLGKDAEGDGVAALREPAPPTKAAAGRSPAPPGPPEYDLHPPKRACRAREVPTATGHARFGIKQL